MGYDLCGGSCNLCEQNVSQVKSYGVEVLQGDLRVAVRG